MQANLTHSKTQTVMKEYNLGFLFFGITTLYYKINTL